jgi:cytochrome b6-f complex iron-sulfur subunit
MPGPPDGGDLAFIDHGRFKCPCHGSIYNRYGQIIQGPAPRPMDRFPLNIDGTGKITVDTGPAKAISRAIASADDAVPPPA